MLNHLTPEDYEKAASIGVDKDNLYNRYYMLGWEKEKAISTPLHTIKPGRQRGVWYEYKELAEANGVAYSTFHNRISQGLSPKRAASLKPSKKRNAVKEELKRQWRED